MTLFQSKLHTADYEIKSLGPMMTGATLSWIVVMMRTICFSEGSMSSYNVIPVSAHQLFEFKGLKF